MPDISVTGMVFRQREGNDCPEFMLFKCTASELLEWCDIDRLEKRRGGKQRSMNSAKIRSIVRFFENPINTIPTGIVVSVALPSDCKRTELGNGLSRFEFHFDENDEKPGSVIDGQHRLLGMAECDDELQVSVTAIVTNDVNEHAFQFLIINSKAAKVATDHVKALLAELEDKNLTNRLRAARLSVGSRYLFVDSADNDEASPFLNMVDWPSNREGKHVVKPMAIETSIRDIQEAGPKLFEDSDVVLDFFFDIWRVIRFEWGDLFNPDSSLLSKVGVVCLTNFIAKSLIAKSDLGELELDDSERVAKHVRIILDFQEEEFWRLDWSARGYDTRAGHKAIVDSLTQIGRNMRAGIAWDEDLAVEVKRGDTGESER